MGDLIGNPVSGELYFISINQFEKIIKSNLSNINKAKLFASFCRINILYMISNAGSGHIGSSFSSIELITWLLNFQLKENDIFFSSKGHDAPAYYNVLIGMGKLEFDLLHKLRKKEGLPGHPDISTPHIITNTGSLGMGISKAKGMIFANRLVNKLQYVYVLTGDGELQEGQIWESLISAKNNCYHELVVIVDHNKLQSDTLVTNVSDLGDLELKFKAFGWKVFSCNGNDLNDIENVFEHVKKDKKSPKVIIANTIKGRGVSFMESSAIDSDVELYKFHSGAPNDDVYKLAIDELIKETNTQLMSLGMTQLELERVKRINVALPLNQERLIQYYSRALVNEAYNNKNIVVLDADLILDTGLIDFRTKFPTRFIECGIAEQDMVSQAGGMALMGLLPIVHSFSCFLSARPNEQIYNNSTELTKIIYVGSLAGVLPAGPGHSHQAIRDISSLSAIPGLIIFEPSCGEELELLLKWAVYENKKSSYLRLVSIPFVKSFDLPEKYKPVLGKGLVLYPGNNGIIIFCYGPILLSIAIKAREEFFNKTGEEITIINMPWLNNINLEWFQSVLQKNDHIISLDNHFTMGGQGSLISDALCNLKLNTKVSLHKIGINEKPISGTNEEVLEYHEITVKKIMFILNSI